MHGLWMEWNWLQTAASKMVGQWSTLRLLAGHCRSRPAGLELFLLPTRPVRDGLFCPAGSKRPAGLLFEVGDKTFQLIAQLCRELGMAGNGGAGHGQWTVSHAIGCMV